MVEFCDLKQAKKKYPTSVIQKRLGENDRKEFDNSLRTELKMRYLYELESAYHMHFEEGMMYPESFVILKNSIDRTMDVEEETLNDWTFISDLIHKNFWVKNGHRFKICKCLFHNFIKRVLF
jgi:hypothetical protein